jgi:hypothetical protein
MPARADLDQATFDNLVDEKGREVLFETALQCPCKSASAGQLGTCKNCGGTGWIFINPIQTRMILSAVNIVSDFKPWSEEMRGTVNVTCKASINLCQMDRITDLNGDAIFSEVLFLKQKGEQIFTYTTYDVKEVLYIGLFVTDILPLRKLIQDEDYVVNGQTIEIINSDLIGLDVDPKDVSFTIRYKHAPSFCVIELKRETMPTFELKSGVEVLNKMPISAIARRTHYQLTAPNLQGDRLLNNSYTE